MTVPAYFSFARWYRNGHLANYVRFSGDMGGGCFDVRSELARVFVEHQRMSPTDYRRAVLDPVRSSIPLDARSALEGRQ